MALDAGVLARIRDEIGDDIETGVSDNTTLETIYNDADRGDSSVLITALLVWRKRLANMNSRAFDIAKEGSWIARSQKVRFLRERVTHYENYLLDKPRGQNAKKLSRKEAEDADAAAELSS